MKKLIAKIIFVIFLIFTLPLVPLVSLFDWSMSTVENVCDKLCLLLLV